MHNSTFLYQWEEWNLIEMITWENKWLHCAKWKQKKINEDVNNFTLDCPGPAQSTAQKQWCNTVWKSTSENCSSFMSLSGLFLCCWNELNGWTCKSYQRYIEAYNCNKLCLCFILMSVHYNNIHYSMNSVLNIRLIKIVILFLEIKMIIVQSAFTCVWQLSLVKVCIKIYYYIINTLSKNNAESPLWLCNVISLILQNSINIIKYKIEWKKFFKILQKQLQYLNK